MTSSPVSKVQFLPDAAAEVTEAMQWYEDRRSGLGADFLVAVDAAVALIARWPEAPPLIRRVRGTPVRRAAISRFPYGLVYYQRAHVLRVVAVAHSRRKPRYWAARV